MPQRDVFERGLDVGAHHPRQAADLLATTGLRLWGMAEEPFCPSLNGSSASRTSVRCRWRISSAIFSSVAVTSASAATQAACRSREITWVAMAAGLRPSRGADLLLRFGADVAEGADGARNFAHAQILGRGFQAPDVAPHLVDTRGPA